MSKPDWIDRQKELEREFAELRKLDRDDPERNQRIREYARMMREVIFDEDLEGSPESISRLRELSDLAAAKKDRTDDIRNAVKSYIEEYRSRNWDHNLWIGADLEMTHVRFDVWYNRDEELEKDYSSGKHDEPKAALRRIAKEVSNAESDVYFHSHQFVKEKCDGDYFRYLR